MARSAPLLWKTMAILFLVVLVAGVNCTEEDIEEEELSDIFDESDDDDSPDTSLATVVKKGRRCKVGPGNICPGIFAKKGTQFLRCCKKHCRNVLSDRNHCGLCGNKCTFAHLCCNGRCTPAGCDVNNCGKCGKKCKPGEVCLFGICGYA